MITLKVASKTLIINKVSEYFPLLSGVVIVNSDTKFAVEQHFHIQCWILSVGKYEIEVGNGSTKKMGKICLKKQKIKQNFHSLMP